MKYCQLQGKVVCLFPLYEFNISRFSAILFQVCSTEMGVICSPVCFILLTQCLRPACVAHQLRLELQQLLLVSNELVHPASLVKQRPLVAVSGGYEIRSADKVNFSLFKGFEKLN